MPRLRQRVLRKLVLTKISVAVLALSSAAALCATARAADVVTLGTATPPSLSDGPVYAMGEALGFFKAEHIDLKITVFQGAGVIIPQVATKQIMIGYPLPDPVLASYANHQPVPVTFFYNNIPRNTMEIGVLANSSVKTLADLKGKAVGVGALTWGTIPGMKALLHEVGLEPGKDVQIAPVGVLGPGFHALKTGQVAALNYNSTWLDMLQQSGTPVRRLTLTPTFEHMVGNAYMANSQALKDNPGVYARFGRAIAKSTLACDANIEACVKAFWKQHPEAEPKTGSAAENLKNAVWILGRRMRLIVPREDSAGRFDTTAITKYVKALRAAGVIQSATVPVDSLFSNQLVAQFNQFDREKVRKMAERYGK